MIDLSFYYHFFSNLQESFKIAFRKYYTILTLIEDIMRYQKKKNYIQSLKWRKYWTLLYKKRLIREYI
jgi:hypothetical protein